jgi:hypothetical protein
MKESTYLYLLVSVIFRLMIPEQDSRIVTLVVRNILRTSYGGDLEEGG